MSIKTLFSIFLSLSMAFLLTGCGGGSEDTASTTTLGTTATTENAISTGSVAILLTDAPIDYFDQFWITVTEISVEGDDGTIVLFTGSERIDLLDLDSYSDLFSVAEDVPAGTYTQITLQVADPLLVRLDSDGNEVESITPEMSGDGELVLNTSTDLVVEPGETLTLQLDLDASKSIFTYGENSYRHRRGGFGRGWGWGNRGLGRYHFRPVVFLDVLSEDGTRGKLVRTEGLVGDVSDDGFELCHQSSNNRFERCFEVTTDEDTAFFDAEGAALETATFVEGDPVAILAYSFRSRGRVFSLEAEIVELADEDIYEQVSGVVDALDLDNNSFTMTADDETVLTVAFADSSKFFAMTGETLSVDDLALEQSVKVEGVLNTEDSVINVSAVFIDVDVPDTEQLTGVVTTIHDDLLGFDISDETLGDVCVSVNSRSDYFLLTQTDDGFSSETVTFSAIQPDLYLEVYGDFDVTGCYVADDVLIEAVETDEEAVDEEEEEEEEETEEEETEE